MDDVQCKVISTPWRIPQAVAVASVGRDALTECKEMRKRARTYKASADGCAADAGRVATTGRALATTSMQRATTGPQCPTTSPQCATTGCNAR